MFDRILWLAVFSFATVACHAEEVVTIPLETIWAYGMPGTHKLTPEPRSPNGEFVSAESQLVDGIYLSLYRLNPKQELMPSFAVSGTGIKALEKVNEVLANRKLSATNFTTTDDVSIAFYSAGRGSHVHVHEVERIGDKVFVRYMFVPHLISPQTSLHFVIIPLGKLPSGKIRVEMIRRIQTSIATIFLLKTSSGVL